MEDDVMSKPGRFDVRDLARRVLVAPMAGGPATPELAAAAAEAGGLGFVAAGYLTADAFAARAADARRLTTGPLGVNLFVPQPSAGTPTDIAAYRDSLAGEAQRYGVAPGEPRFDDDAWAAKLDVVHDLRPEVVSFTFGLPSAQEADRLRAAGIVTVGTVTTAAEARAAVACGMDVVAAQGPAAGGHRGTFDPSAAPATEPLPELLASVLAVVDVPVVAAGGLAEADDVAAVLDAGAVAAQLGTAFLLADEAGSTPVHRAALQDPAFTETVVTRAFTGRYARGLRNRFIAEHEPDAPFGYPEVHYVTSPLRKASVAAGDPHATNIWAGTAFRKTRTGSTADILAALT
jgi:nitronate monooxygenase